jgi:hypothetical protein
LRPETLTKMLEQIVERAAIRKPRTELRLLVE